MYAYSYGDMEGGISCTIQSSIQQVQPVLRPKFVSSAAKLEKHPGY